MYIKTKRLLLSIFSSINIFAIKGNAAISCIENKNAQSTSDAYLCEIKTPGKKSQLGYLDKNIYDDLKKSGKIQNRFSTEGSETGSKTTNGT